MSDKWTFCPSNDQKKCICALCGPKLGPPIGLPNSCLYHYSIWEPNTIKSSSMCPRSHQTLLIHLKIDHFREKYLEKFLSLEGLHIKAVVAWTSN